MAETAVNFVTDKLIPLLIEEVKLQRGVHGQVQLIKQELETIQSFLRDADAKAEREETNSVLKNWVKQVRKVALRKSLQVHEKTEPFALCLRPHRHILLLQPATILSLKSPSLECLLLFDFAVGP